jgi:hypothetical protein
MADYTFGPQAAVDIATGQLVKGDGVSGSVYGSEADAQAETSPLTVVVAGGISTTVVEVSDISQAVEFTATDHQEVWWRAPGGPIAHLVSFDGFRDSLAAAATAAQNSAVSAQVAAEAAEDIVASSMATYIALATHRDDENFARPNVLGPVLWLGTVYPLNSQSHDVVATAAPTSGGGFEGAFDDFTIPWRAYSLRRLLASYTGPLVRVRRSSDDTTLDVGYNADGTLDTVSLLAFVGANNGFVSRWFDQTGGTAHLEQGTLGSQPSIVTAGVLNTLDSLPAITFDGVADWLTTASAGLFNAGAATMAIVFSGASSSNAVVVGESNSGGGGALYRLMRSSTAAWNTQATNSSGVSMWASSAAGDTTFDAAQHQAFFTDSGAQINTWRDGVAKHAALAAVRSGVTTLTNLSLGAHLNGGTPTNFLTGKVQELVLWNSNEAVDRVPITAAQKDFWGTP